MQVLHFANIAHSTWSKCMIAEISVNFSNGMSIRVLPWSKSLLNSLRPSDAIWRHRSGSTLAHVMACCLTAPSHYLNKCWLMISEVMWHSPDSNFIENIYLSLKWVRNLLIWDCSQIKGQWVNYVKHQKQLQTTRQGRDVWHAGKIYNWNFLIVVNVQ